MAIVSLIIDAQAESADGRLATGSVIVGINVPDAEIRAASHHAAAPSPYAGGVTAPLPGQHAVAPGAPGYNPLIERSRQTWSGWASR